MILQRVCWNKKSVGLDEIQSDLIDVVTLQLGVVATWFCESVHVRTAVIAHCSQVACQGP